MTLQVNSTSTVPDTCMDVAGDTALRLAHAEPGSMSAHCMGRVHVSG